MADAVIPQPPPGFTLDPSSDIPPPPPGFTMDTPGGAAMGNPNISGQGARSVGARVTNPDSLEAIAGAGGIGAVAGATAPEILGGIGAGATAVGFPGVGTALSGMGNAMRGQRISGAISGGISGLASETAGQVAEGMDAPQPVAEAARFGVGAVAPEAAGLARIAGGKIAVAYRGLKALAGVKEDLSAAETKRIADGIASLRGGEKSDAPFKTIFEELQAATDNSIALNEQKVKTILSEADRTANNIVSDAQKGPVAGFQAAKENLAKLNEATTAAAKNQRLAIGADREVSDIGGELRDVVTTRNADALAARKAAWDKVVADRNSMVSNLENSGVTIDKMPEFEALKKSLADDAVGRSQPVKDAYAKILALLKPSIEGEKALALNGQNLDWKQGQGKVTFQQMDDVRRLLGEIFSNRPPEGYEAIKGDMMRKYYSQISDIQKQFAGGKDGIQSQLLSKYANDTAGLEQFASKAGAKLTALDRNDPTKFANDASMLPKQFFKSQQGFNDLVELTGSKDLATKAGLDFATNELRDANQATVRRWMTNNEDWLKAAPEVRMAVSKYADTLETAAKGVIANEAKVKLLTAAENEAIKIAEASAKEVQRNAERIAKTQTTEVQKLADEMVGNKYDAEVIPKLFKSGDFDEVARAAVVINMSPKARDSVSQAVRQMLANDAERSVANLSADFEKVSRRVVRAGLMSAEESLAISQQLRAIENSGASDQVKLGWAKRLFLQAMTAEASSLGARGAVGVKNRLSEMYKNPDPTMLNGIPRDPPNMKQSTAIK